MAVQDKETYALPAEAASPAGAGGAEIDWAGVPLTGAEKVLLPATPVV